MCMSFGTWMGHKMAAFFYSLGAIICGSLGLILLLFSLVSLNSSSQGTYFCFGSVGLLILSLILYVMGKYHSETVPVVQQTVPVVQQPVIYVQHSKPSPPVTIVNENGKWSAKPNIAYCSKCGNPYPTIKTDLNFCDKCGNQLR